MGIISYAQNFEDVILWRVLMDVKDGFYIDVGANDPIEMSVTKWFYDQGWHGINMEPSEEYFRKICEARPRDINLQQGAGKKRGQLKFYEIPETGLSTTDGETASRHRTAGFRVEEKEIEIVPLKDVCEAYAQEHEIHFLKVDVEGSESDVLTGMDFQRFRPWILVVEATLPNSTVLSVDWDPWVRSQDYDFTLFDGLNYYYVAKERAQAFGARLAVPANIFDGFVQASTVQLTQQRDALEQKLAQMTQTLEQMREEMKRCREECDETQMNDTGAFRLKGAILE